MIYSSPWFVRPPIQTEKCSLVLWPAIQSEKKKKQLVLLFMFKVLIKWKDIYRRVVESQGPL